MICRTCYVAGVYSQIRNEGERAPSPASMHAKCEAPTTCTCQHKTGEWINRREVS